MAKVSLKKGKSEEKNDDQELSVKEQENAVSTYVDSGSEVQGEWGMEHLKIPTLNVVAKTGKLSDEFTPGTFLFDKELPLTDPKKDKEILVTFLSLRLYYMEDLPFDEEIRPRLFDTAKEVQEAGLSLKYDAENRAKPCAYATVLVPMPEELAHFLAPEELHEGLKNLGWSCGGEPTTGFGRAAWNLTGTAFTSVAKPVYTASQVGNLKENLFAAPFRASFIMKASKNNSWVQPTIRPAGRFSPEVIKWIKEEIAL